MAEKLHSIWKIIIVVEVIMIESPIPIAPPGTKKILLWFQHPVRIRLFPILALGILACIMISWNARQAEFLLSWAREKVGRDLWIALQRAVGGPLRQFIDSPEIFHRGIAETDEILAGGIMGPKGWVSISPAKVDVDFQRIELPGPESSKLLDNDFACIRLFFRSGSPPGSGGGMRRGNGFGPAWRLNDRSQHEASLPPQAPEFQQSSTHLLVQQKGLDDKTRIAGAELPSLVATSSPMPGGPFEVVILFREPRTRIDRPLRLQQGLWLAMWVVVSLFWLGFQKANDALAEMRRRQQNESHLAAAGRMTARMAHEIKNPLGAIRGSAQYLLGKFGDDQKATSMLTLIESETIRLEELTRAILDFARPPTLQWVQLDLIALLELIALRADCRASLVSLT